MGVQMACRTGEVSVVKIESDRILESILESLSKMEYVKASEIPNIDLYMDQVLTFMNGHLENAKRYETDKVMTKTMINNYAKNHLLPAPEKKKYTKEHIMVLMFIYYFKNILSIGDIQSILNPLTERYFANGKELNLEKIYEEVFSLETLTVDGHVKRGVWVPSHLHFNLTYLAEAEEEEEEKLVVREDENSAVQWWTFEEALKVSTEPWMVEHIYKKLIEKLES